MPPEQTISERLRVGRGAVREAKALLSGQGLLLDSPGRSRVGRSEASWRVNVWIQSIQSARGEPAHRHLRDVLALRRLILAEAFGRAVRRGTANQRAALREAVTRLTTAIELRFAHTEILFEFERLLLLSCEVARSDGLGCLATVLMDGAKLMPLWHPWVLDRTGWLKLLADLPPFVDRRQSRAATRWLRQGLLPLDRSLCEAVTRAGAG